MTKRMIFSIALLFGALGLMCLANALQVRGAQPAAVSTTTVTSRAQAATDCKDRKAVARAIYVLLKEKGFTKEQLDRINVSYDAGTKVVTLRGFATPTSPARSQRLGRVNQVGRMARQATTCETSVNNRLTPNRRPNCPQGKKACGETGQCIPEEEECNAGTMP